MSKVSLFVLFLCLCLPGGMALAADLTEGDPAPRFELKGSDGKVYTLKEFIGEKPVVLAWFPKAFTGG